MKKQVLCALHNSGAARASMEQHLEYTYFFIWRWPASLLDYSTMNLPVQAWGGHLAFQPCRTINNTKQLLWVYGLARSYNKELIGTYLGFDQKINDWRENKEVIKGTLLNAPTSKYAATFLRLVTPNLKVSFSLMSVLSASNTMY